MIPGGTIFFKGVLQVFSDLWHLLPYQKKSFVFIIDFISTDVCKLF